MGTSANLNPVFPPGGYPAWDPSTSVVSFARHELHKRIVWDVHPYPEITLMLEGRGLRGVSNIVEPYQEGDLCLFAEGTPHAWVAEPDGGRVRAAVVHFSRPALATALSAPEMTAVRSLLQRARSGVVIGGVTRDAVAEEILKLQAEPTGSWRRILRLLDSLAIIAAGADTRSVVKRATGGRELHHQTDPRLAEVLKYIDRSDGAAVSHREAASAAGLSPAAFSRFFKRFLGRTFEQYVNQVRIARACSALAETDRAVIDVAFEAGFNSVSHFNRRFRDGMGMTPTAYRQLVARRTTEQ